MGDGNFQAPQTFIVGDSPASLAVGDLNGDGKPDVAVANAMDDDVAVLINTSEQVPATFYELAVSKDGNGGGTVSSTSNPPGSTKSTAARPAPPPT